MGILLHRVHAVPVEARRGHQIPLEQESLKVVSVLLVLGI